MRITPKLLSIPPYISTSWDNISSLYIKLREGTPILKIALLDGAQVEIENLSQSEIDAIFHAHAEFAMDDPPLKKDANATSHTFTLPFKSGELSLDSFESHMQHNPAQANLPPLPPKVLEKIAAMIKALGLEDPSILDKPEDNCNCIYCQLSRSLQNDTEELVEESDLQFRDWEVSQKEDKLYHVTNPLDKNEYYDVFLGDPIGCTCGSKNCEHIKAVLKT